MSEMAEHVADAVALSRRQRRDSSIELRAAIGVRGSGQLARQLKWQIIELLALVQEMAQVAR